MSSVSDLDISALQPGCRTNSVATAALEGLSANEKWLPCWLLYDAEGSRLFEAITRLPEYYLTAREEAIFSRSGAEMIAAAAGTEKKPLSVVELGAGSARKTLTLLRVLAAAQKRVVYIPVDVSQAALDAARRNVRAALPSVTVQPLRSQITGEEPLNLPLEGRRLALYIGSSIGNFDLDQAIDLLAWLRGELKPGDALLLGTDMVKDPELLVAAYNDSAGVTAAFSKNILARLNRELEADFSLDAFEHLAVWNPKQSRMEIYLESKRSQTVQIAQLERNFSLCRGELIHTENSHKFTPESVESLLSSSGFEFERSWYDDDRWFGVHLARVVDSQALEGTEGESAA
jgi:dimethylhistidine N-methyltransferase